MRGSVHDARHRSRAPAADSRGRARDRARSRQPAEQGAHDVGMIPWAISSGVRVVTVIDQPVRDHFHRGWQQRLDRTEERDRDRGRQQGSDPRKGDKGQRERRQMGRDRIRAEAGAHSGDAVGMGPPQDRDGRTRCNRRDDDAREPLPSEARPKKDEEGARDPGQRRQRDWRPGNAARARGNLLQKLPRRRGIRPYPEEVGHLPHHNREGDPRRRSRSSPGRE